MAVYPALIVGTDGSKTAERAVRAAGVLAAGLGAPLLVATVYRRPLPQELGPPSVAAEYPTDAWISSGFRGAQEVAQDGAALATAAAHESGSKDLAVDTATPEAAPADGLLDLAEANPGSLLVVGSQGLSASARALLGNVPHKVSHHAVGDTLIVATDKDRPAALPRSVLVGTDGSPTSLRAVDRALEVTRALGAGITILSVGEPARTRAALDLVGDRAAGSGVEWELQQQQGDPSEVLVDIGARHDLVVVGNRGMTGAARFLLGSVPNKVSHHSATDLLIVKTT